MLCLAPSLPEFPLLEKWNYEIINSLSFEKHRVPRSLLNENCHRLRCRPDPRRGQGVRRYHSAIIYPISGGEVNALDITPDQFYDRLEAMQPHIPTTAQPSEGIFSEIYHKVAEKGEQVLSIHISSGLSGTINSARPGAEQLAATDRTWSTP